MSESLNGKAILITGAARWVGNSVALACARIANILDWHALHPGADHFPYTISKAPMAAITKSPAVALAPKIIVVGWWQAFNLDFLQKQFSPFNLGRYFGYAQNEGFLKYG